jgi:D-glycero-D-manno-heptose 1,7-bisphosphate phosphatase
MNKAVFFDRDGVINDPKGLYYVSRKEDFFLNDGILEVMAELQHQDYLLFVITNQGGVSRGKYSIEDVHDVHRYMEALLAEKGIYLTGIYFCPHHDRIENCLCRKPKPLLLEKAIAAYDIDPEKSWMVGDKETDSEAGKRAGLHTLMVQEDDDLRNILEVIS